MKKTKFWIIFLFFFILELFFYTWCRVQCVATGYEIAKLNKDYNKYITLKNNLKIELASLKSPNRITKIAKKYIGLDMPSSNKEVILP